MVKVRVCPCYGPLISRARRKKGTITWAQVKVRVRVRVP